LLVTLARRVAAGEEIAGLGLSIASVVSEDKTRVTASNNNPDWQGRDIIPIISERVNCPVLIEDDASAESGALANYGHNLPQEFDYVVWGTGVGMSHVSKKPNEVPQIIPYDWNEYGTELEANCGGAALLAQYDGKLGAHSNEWSNVYRRFTDGLRAHIDRTGVRTILLGGGLAVMHSRFLEDINGTQEVYGAQVELNEFGSAIGLMAGVSVLFSRQNELHS
jgi:hypothetical protein